MFESTSRYHPIETATLTAPDGRVLAYKRRRFLPLAPPPTIAEVVVTQDDRLDLIAARTLGEPEFFWWICDANRVLDPADLLARSGRRLLIPGPPR
jgi:hypothetical protein